MSEPSRPLRPGRGGRGRRSPASLGIVTVDADFPDEYPGGDAACTEAYASLCRTGEALLGEHRRDLRHIAGRRHGAGRHRRGRHPLTPSQVSDRVLIASATMTATLDMLERRGWIRRVPNPADRRSVLIEITAEGRATTDQLLPGIRTIERSILSALTPGERAHLLDLLAKILTRTAEVAAGPPEPLHGQRNRPARLTPGKTPSPAPGQPPAPSQPHPSTTAENAPKSQSCSPPARPSRTQMRVTGPCRLPPADRAHIMVICAWRGADARALRPANSRRSVVGLDRALATFRDQPCSTARDL